MSVDYFKLLLKKIDELIEDNKKIHDYFDTIVGMLEEGGSKLDRLLASGGEEPWECPICHKTVYIGYTTHRHCLDKLLEDSGSLKESPLTQEQQDHLDLTMTNELHKQRYEEVTDPITKVTVSIKKEPTVKEEIDMDFSQVTVMNQTPLALLVVKKGYQQWLARQFIKDPLELGYQNGNVYNIELKVESNSGKPISWVTTKWVPFEVFKG